MTPADDVTSAPSTSPVSDAVASLDGPARLRGADAAAVTGRLWTIAGGVVLALLAVAIVVGLVSAANDNARINRLRDHGVAVTVTVSTCIGNLGGSGSNAANFTCRGRYRVKATDYVETIDGLTTFVAPGRHVAAVADPADLGAVTLATTVASSRASNARFAIPGLLGLSWLVLVLGYLRRLRRSRVRPAITEAARN